MVQCHARGPCSHSCPLSPNAECEAGLAAALPVLEAALSALDTIKPADIKLVQSFKNPPAAIKLVMEAVCVVLDVAPAKVSGTGVVCLLLMGTRLAGAVFYIIVCWSKEPS